MPTHRRLCRPYFDAPRVRGRCRTGTEIDLRARALEQRRQEAMHVIEARQLEKRRAMHAA